VASNASVPVLRSVFVGTPGFLGRIDGETRCAFWVEEPVDHDFDPARLIEVDLGRTPSAVLAKEIGWDDVQVDDCLTGPNGVLTGTTLGPRWPELHLSGALYLEQRFVQALPQALRPPCPPTGMQAYPHECMTCVYWPQADDPRAGHRYTGHHAEILDEQGDLAFVAVWPPGRSGSATVPAVRMWIDLTSAQQCDAGPDSLTRIGTGAAAKSGALFLISGRLSAEPLEES
jgi:hypothetical protein